MKDRDERFDEVRNDWDSLWRGRLSEGPDNASAPSHKFCGRFWHFIMLRELKIRISKSEIRNNIKILMFKIYNKPDTKCEPWFFRFGHSYFVHLNLFRVSIFEFRISGSLGSGSSTDRYSIIPNCHFRGQNFWDTAIAGSAGEKARPAPLEAGPKRVGKKKR